MKLLQDLYEKNKYSDDMSDAVPEEYMKEIKKNIRDGAANVKLKFANALELCHKAYKVANVQRPFPSIKNSWKQYEENLAYAVQQLALHRGMKSDWRMSSSVFHEATNQHKFLVSVFNGEKKKSFIIESDNIDKVLDELSTKTFGAYKMLNETGTKTFGDYDIEQKQIGDKVKLIPRRFGIKQPFSIVVEYLNTPLPFTTKDHEFYNFEFNGEQFGANFTIDSVEGMMNPSEMQSIVELGLDPEGDLADFTFGQKKQYGHMNFKKTDAAGQRGAINVFSTIRLIVNDFVKHNRSKVQGIIFAADINEPSRVRLYKRMLPAIAKEINARPHDIGADDYDHFFLLTF